MVKQKKTQKSTNNSSHHDGRAKLTKQIALGATGVAITAGVVAAGAALMNRRTRSQMGKMVSKGRKMLEEMPSDMYEMYQRPTAHQVAGPARSKSHSRRGSKTSKSGRSSKTGETAVSGR
jgi:hypothetical protein